MLESYLPSPWLLFMMVTIVVALIASAYVNKDNKRLRKEFDDRSAASKDKNLKAKALQTQDDTNMPAHG